MPRKWTTLAAALATVLLTASGLSFADDDSPLHKLMEKVNAKNNAITKAVRTPVAYKKAQKDLAAYADDLAKLGKEARDMKSAAEKQKKSVGEWTKLMDDYVKSCEEFKDVVSKSETGQAEAKSAHGKVKATCTACHNVFRVDE